MIEEFPAEWLLYLRKSKGYAGIARQRAATTAMIERRGGRVVLEFEDADKTAYRNTHHDLDAPLPPRPRFDAMLAEMAKRPGVGVAAWHADRLGRDPDEASAIILACRRDGGHLVATKAGGDYDCTNNNGRSHLRDDINKAHDEVDHGVERMLEAKAEAVTEGRWLGGPRPFGWTVQADGALVLHDAEAKAIAAACDAVLAGATLVAVTRQWHAAGLTGTRGGLQAPEAVRKILLRPRNAGLMEHRGQVTGKASWPSIVDEDTWRAIRALLTDPARKMSPGPAPRWLMTGIALCGACGATVLIGCRGGSRQPSYRCSKSQRKLPRRAGPHVCRAAAAVDAYVRALVIGRLQQDDASALLRPDHSGERGELLRQDDELRALYDEQWQLYQAKAITARELTEGRAQISARRSQARERLAALAAADAVAPFLADPEGAWDAAPLDRRQALVSALMHVTILAAPPPGALRPVGVPSFDPDSVDVRWARRLPSDS